MTSKHHILSVFLLIWALTATFFLLKNHHLKDSFTNIFLPTQKKITNHYKKEVPFLYKALNDYYSIDYKTSIEKKLNTLSSNFTPKLQTSILKEYQDTLGYFHRKKGQQKIHLKKILRHKKTSKYTVFFYIQQFPNHKKSTRYLIKLNLELTTHSSQIKFSQWEEKILKYPPPLLSRSKIYIDKSSATRIVFPCKIRAIKKIKNTQQVEMEVKSDSHEVIFRPQKKTPSQPAIFSASCHKKKFNLALYQNDHLQTVHDSLSITQGKQIKLLLTSEEKLKLDIEKQLGIIVTE